MAIDRELKILLVEDSRITRVMEKKVLKELGFNNIIEAADGREAVRILMETEDIRLIISDWNMPNMDGYEFLKWVRSDDEFLNIPFLMATAQAQKSQKNKAFDAGVTEIVTKPFSPNELLEAIENSIQGIKNEEVIAEKVIHKTESGKILLKVAHIQITDHIILGVLKHLIENKTFSPEHFELETKCMSSWNPVQKSLENGEIDAAFVLAPIAMDCFSYGTPIKLILFAHKNGSIFVNKKVEDSSMNLDYYFKNRIFYLPHLNSIHHMLSSIFLNEIGLNPGLTGNDDVNVYLEVVPPVTMPDFLAKNSDVSGYMVAEPLGSKAIGAGDADLTFLSGELWDSHPCCVVAMRDEVIDQESLAVQEFVDFLVKAGKYVAQNPEDSAKIAVKFLDPEKKLGLKSEILTKVLTAPQGIKTDDLYPVKQDLDIIQKYLSENRNVMKPVDLEKFVYTKFADNACKIDTKKEYKNPDFKANAEKIIKKLKKNINVKSLKKPVKKQKTEDLTPATKEISPEKKKEKSISIESSIRVSVTLLDSLMNLAGELVLSRNQLVRAISAREVQVIDIAKQRIDIVTSELQEAIMQTRMQPIGKIFDKYPRVVRDLAKTLGKKVKLVVEGKDVELDKSILEGLNDPLTHMIRNSIDHGIETPKKRLDSNKNDTGTLYLKAFHEAGQIMIEIVDDGKGIDGNFLCQKAISKEIITKEQSLTMSDKEKINLIFHPGFSTAEKVSDVSGRGVGMDVVKSNLDKLGGIVDVHSEVGKGTTVSIKLPLTLAIIPSLLVSSGTEKFAIPQVNLDELLRIPYNQIKKRIEVVGEAKVVRLRDELLPIIDLAQTIGIEKSKRDKGAVNIAVVSAGNSKYGLVVDTLHDSEEIVVKPLGRHISKCKEYAGATILGDGKVALILDVSNLSRKSLTNISERLIEENVSEKTHKKIRDIESFLTFRSAQDEQFAVPLNMVARIERIKKSDMEKIGNRNVIQFMDGSIPLFTMHEVANVKPIEDTNRYIIIVFNISGKEFGLLATGPLDSLDLEVNVDERVFKQPGIIGSMIVKKTTTLIVDIYGFIETIQPQWLETDKKIESAETVLLVEDTPFFRKQMASFLKDEGLKVIIAEDGIEALDSLNENYEKISIIITDIEMPNMNGFELTRKIKSNSKFKHLPVIAVTSLSEEKHKIEGLKAGIDDYQLKLDRDRLLKSIQNYLNKN